MATEKRLIDANALTDEFLRHYTEQEKKGNLSFVACEIKQGFADMVNEAPTVDAVEVVHGRWKFFGSTFYQDFYKCSVCGSSYDGRPNYCPNCGAKMDGERKDNDL